MPPPVMAVSFEPGDPLGDGRSGGGREVLRRTRDHLIFFQILAVTTCFSKTGGYVISAHLSRSHASSDYILTSDVISFGMSWKLSQDTVNQDQFRQLATSGLSDRKIAATLGCSVTTVGRWRDLFGIPRSKIAGRGAVQAIDGHFLAQIDTPEKAYILGFLIADGHVYGSGDRVELGVKEADSAILTAITEAAGLSDPAQGQAQQLRQVPLHLCRARRPADGRGPSGAWAA